MAGDRITGADTMIPLGCPYCDDNVLVQRRKADVAIDAHNDSKHEGRPIAGIAVLDPDDTVHFVPHPGDMTDDQFAFVQAVLSNGDGDHDTPWEVTD